MNKHVIENMIIRGSVDENVRFHTYSQTLMIWLSETLQLSIWIVYPLSLMIVVSICLLIAKLCLKKKCCYRHLRQAAIIGLAIYVVGLYAPNICNFIHYWIKDVEHKWFINLLPQWAKNILPKGMGGFYYVISNPVEFLTHYFVIVGCVVIFALLCFKKSLSKDDFFADLGFWLTTILLLFVCLYVVVMLLVPITYLLVFGLLTLFVKVLIPLIYYMSAYAVLWVFYSFPVWLAKFYVSFKLLFVICCCSLCGRSVVKA